MMKTVFECNWNFSIIRNITHYYALNKKLALTIIMTDAGYIGYDHIGTKDDPKVENTI